MHYISETQFLVLARDSNAGHGAESTESIYRNADVIDISKATNVAGTVADANDGQIASKDGVLKSSIVPATYCQWLSYNNNAQLGRFGLHNGGAQDANLLNEKWESFAMLPVDKDDEIGRSERQDEDEGKQYYLVSFSDNDFITQNGKLFHLINEPVLISCRLHQLRPEQVRRCVWLQSRQPGSGVQG
jgi:hypothetical protein